MKLTKTVFLIVIASLILSIWSPATPVSAQTSQQRLESAPIQKIGAEGTKYATLVIDNRTGGTIYLSLDPQPYQRKKPKLIPPKSYSFLVINQGKTRFEIIEGIYQYTIRSSNCGGKRLNTKTFKGVTILGPYYCDK